CAVEQAGSGSEAMIEVGKTTPADALYIVSSLAAPSPAFPRCGGKRGRSEIVRFALGGRVLYQRVVGFGQGRAGIAEAVDDGIAAGAAGNLPRHLDARRRLPALLLRGIVHALALHDRLPVEDALAHPRE